MRINFRNADGGIFEQPRHENLIFEQPRHENHSTPLRKLCASRCGRAMFFKSPRLEKGPQYNVSVASHLADLAERSSGYDPSLRPVIYYSPQTGRRVVVLSEVPGERLKAGSWPVVTGRNFIRISVRAIRGTITTRVRPDA